MTLNFNMPVLDSEVKRKIERCDQSNARDDFYGQ